MCVVCMCVSFLYITLQSDAALLVIICYSHFMLLVCVCMYQIAHTLTQSGPVLLISLSFSYTRFSRSVENEGADAGRGG